MSDHKVLASDKDAKRKGGEKRIDPILAWAVLGWAGIVFLIVGGSDFALTWYPMNFGNREWEFGTVTASFNGLPILVMGVGFLLAASLQLGRKWWAGLAFVVSAILTLWIIAGAFIWATNVPLALQAAPAEVMTGIKKALVKTTIQSLTYPVLFGFLAYKSFQVVRGKIAESA